MPGVDLFDEGDDGTVFRDVIMLALLGFVTIVVLLLPHLNPPTKPTDEQQPGNIIVELHWPDDMNTDVDLWVKAPGDKPVGYSNRGGRVFNLLRDDMGHVNDVGKLNYEIAFSRGAPQGEYIVNLHLYSNSDGRKVVPTQVTVGIKKDEKGTMRVIHRRQVELAHTGQEITVIRFTLDEKSEVLPDSLHDLPRRLRSAHGFPLNPPAGHNG
ncbi:MAG: hypothetical protein JSU82_18075 [Rhodospirillales bacterium]|nr:MAG: hypothetical protein JSU82_18075 [Rhodospirillales bacterium]